MADSIENVLSTSTADLKPSSNHKTLNNNKERPSVLNPGVQNGIETLEQSTSSSVDYETWEVLRSEGKELSNVAGYTKPDNATQKRRLRQAYANNGTKRQTEQESSSFAEITTYSQVLNDVEPSEEELEGMLVPKPAVTSDINAEGELFQSIPNLTYSRLDQEGNIVGSERNLLYVGRQSVSSFSSGNSFPF